jgi:speckle-type POZ protein
MSSSTPSGIAKMIVQYEWILGNVDGEPKTFASKMILFRGEKVFRVGLKNLADKPVLFFMAIDLNKMGMKVEQVMCSDVPTMMLEMEKQNIGDEGSLQLFTIEFKSKFTGTYGTFLFRIQMEGSVPEFSYQLSERLAKNQLWDSATVNSQRSAVDVELNVRDRTFSAHKAILAARSPVFANEFAKTQPLTNGQPQKIQIDGVEPSTVEQFLYFIYTGESISSFANEELLKLAVKYQLTTLSSLCRTALKKIETTQLVNLTSSLHVNPVIHPSIIR